MSPVRNCLFVCFDVISDRSSSVIGPFLETLHYISLHYVISNANNTYRDQWCINKVIQVLRMRAQKGEFSKVF